MAAAATKPFRIGMLGAGTVGGGVYELIVNNAGAASSPRRPVTITKICVRALDKKRDFEIDPSQTVVTTNVTELLTDDIDCLVEVAGGCGDVVRGTVLEALAKGKAVVTANKALRAELAAKLPSFEAITAEEHSRRIDVLRERNMCSVYW